MKKLFMMMAAISMLTFGMVSCNRNDDTMNNPTNPTNPTNPSTPENLVQCGETHGEWVDLDLPSGQQWYSVNIGATSPEVYGDYFAWGERHVKDDFSWTAYIYGDWDTKTFTLYKYNTLEGYGTVDNKTILDASDDVATAVLGTDARIPTSDDWVELIDNTTGEWTEQNGVNGWKFTATNGQSIFLPAAGARTGGSLLGSGSYGHYWSSSICTDRPIMAHMFSFDSNGSYMDFSYGRNYVKTVRAVRASQN